jgi:hypothetical protein
MISVNEKKKEQSRRYGHGKSKAAEQRLINAHRGQTHSGQPGDVIQMSDRIYLVAKDGSFRRAEVKAS